MSANDRLRAIRERLGESQRAMSVRLGLGVNTWPSYERGESAPKGEVLAQLAELGFSVDWLLTGEGSMMRPDLVVTGQDGRLLAVMEAKAGPQLAESQAPHQHQPALTQDLVATALQVIEEWLEENDRHLPPAKKAEVVVLLCEMVLKEKAADRAGELARQAGRILRLVA